MYEQHTSVSLLFIDIGRVIGGTSLRWCRYVVYKLGDYMNLDLTKAPISNLSDIADVIDQFTTSVTLDDKAYYIIAQLMALAKAPQVPQPPIKRKRLESQQGFFSSREVEEIEYDHNAPEYLKALDLYYKTRHTAMSTIFNGPFGPIEILRKA
jgi:hypothetical protein